MRRIAAALTVLLLAACSNQLDYDAVGIHAPVIAGGQRQIDQGHVVEVDLPGIWIAAHRTSAGGPFRNLPQADVGDRFCVSGGCYLVTSIIIVPQSWPVRYLGQVVLQTSLPGGQALLVIADWQT